MEGFVLPRHRQVSGVIRISEFDESPEQAVQTILASPHFFADVHLVKFGHSSLEKFYPGWDKDLAALRALNLDPVWHSQLDHKKLKTHALVNLTPDVRSTDGALATLIDDMDKNGGSCDHFGVSSITFIEYDTKPVSPVVVLEAMFSYGFLLVILMMDTFRSIINLFQYHRTSDLTCDFTTTTYGGRVRVAPNRFLFWWFFTGISPSKRGGAACMQIPSENDQGLTFLLRTIKTHSNGLWIFGFALYWWLFSWPLANYILDSRTRWGYWLIRDMTALYWAIPYILNTALVGYVAWMHVEFPFRLLPVHVLLFTFFLTASPLILLYGRFHTSRASWKKK